MVRRIELHIDHITLRGSDAIDKKALATAIVGQLRSALEAPGASASLGQGRWASRLDAGRVAAASSGSKALGKAVAQATLGVLKR